MLFSNLQVGDGVTREGSMKQFPHAHGLHICMLDFDFKRGITRGHLQCNDDVGRCHYGVDDCVGHGSVAAAPLYGDLELLTRAHERPCSAAQSTRRQEWPHMQPKDCIHTFQSPCRPKTFANF